MGTFGLFRAPLASFDLPTRLGLRRSVLFWPEGRENSLGRVPEATMRNFAFNFDDLDFALAALRTMSVQRWKFLLIENPLLAVVAVRFRLPSSSCNPPSVSVELRGVDTMLRRTPRSGGSRESRTTTRPNGLTPRPSETLRRMIGVNMKALVDGKSHC